MLHWSCSNKRHVEANFEEKYSLAASFLAKVGRMKYVRPLFRALNKAKNGSELAKQTFIQLRGFYHPICARLVAKDLGIEYAN